MYNLNGKVKSGLGEASFWVSKINEVFEKKYKIKLFFGTLNVKLDKEYILNESEKINSYEYGGGYDVFIQKCKIFESDAYILRAEKNNQKGGDHPLDIIEIVTNINLREAYNLKDDDVVSIYIIE